MYTFRGKVREKFFLRLNLRQILLSYTGVRRILYPPLNMMYPLFDRPQFLWIF